ncbi:MAG: SURF1 family protein [Aeromicrobium sp.]
MFRFLLSRRWVGFAIFVIVLAAGSYRLGFWQWHRLEGRLDENKVITKHFKAAPVDLDSVLTLGKPQTDLQQWTRIRATGSYDVSHQVTVRFSTRDGAPGADVVTPLVLPSGAAMLVDRGWIATTNNSMAPSNVPAPPSGTVTITGWLRANNGDRHRANIPSDHQIRAISSAGMKSFVPYKLYDGYLNLRSESPAPSTPLSAEPKPELGQGPHLFYALQWWFFAILATFGWFYFAWVEERERRKQVALANHRNLKASPG